MKNFIYLIFVLIFHPFIANCQFLTSHQGIREIPIRNLPDIAIASFDNLGPVIYFHPSRFQQVGDLAAAFIMAHEYGHHHQGHIVHRLWSANNPYVQTWLNINMENDADAYAVRYWVNQGNQAVVQAGANFMWNANDLGDNTHPPSRVRARNIENYFFQITGRLLFP